MNAPTLLLKRVRDISGLCAAVYVKKIWEAEAAISDWSTRNSDSREFIFEVAASRRLQVSWIWRDILVSYEVFNSFSQCTMRREKFVFVSGLFNDSDCTE